MKIWNDFFVKYPNQNCCLVFEDDFICPSNGKYIIKKAIKFTDKHYEFVDILNLHNIYVPVNNILNNDFLKNGYGFNTHAYLITRRYIESIITKYKKLPEPNGIHLDYAINIYKESPLYSNKLFFTTNKCFTQLIDKSNNYINKFDEIFRNDLQKTQKNVINFCTFCKTHKLLNDNNIKKIWCKICKIIT